MNVDVPEKIPTIDFSSEAPSADSESLPSTTTDSDSLPVTPMSKSQDGDIHRDKRPSSSKKVHKSHSGNDSLESSPKKRSFRTDSPLDKGDLTTLTFDPNTREAFKIKYHTILSPSNQRGWLILNYMTNKIVGLQVPTNLLPLNFSGLRWRRCWRVGRAFGRQTSPVHFSSHPCSIQGNKIAWRLHCLDWPRG